MVPIQLILASIAGAQETVLYDFWSPTCGPCRQMEPTVGRLISAGFPVRKVNVMGSPEERALAARFRVSRVPSFVMVSGGRETDREEGTTSYGRLEQMVARARPAAPPSVQPQMQPRPASPTRLDSPWSRHAPLETAVSVPAPQTWPASDPGQRLAISNPAVSPAAPPVASASVYGRSGNPLEGASAASDPADRSLIEHSVRLRVEDTTGHSWGTGTMVDTRSGDVLIVTCGHLFREMQRDPQRPGTIGVELFSWTPSGPTVVAVVPGELISFDLDRDIGLVSIRPGREVRIAPIAGPGTDTAVGAAVRSVGCSQGEKPTVIATQVTNVNRYMGSANIEAAGAPIEGRSGGGLFNAAGQLIGICFAADHAGNEGLYAGLEAIHDVLDKIGLTEIYQQNGSPSAALAAGPADTARAAVEPIETAAVESHSTQPIADARLAPPAEMTVPVNTVVREQDSESELSPAEQAAWEEIMDRASDSEVVCIVRPKLPDGRSEIITLSNVSDAFVRRLAEAGATSGSGLRTVPAAPTAPRTASIPPSPWDAAR
jgi:thiol-disulfide isomerase/thioredoxin